MPRAGGLISTFFDGIAVKRLSAVETSPTRSHQHEFNGVQSLKEILGQDSRAFAASFIYIGEGRADNVAAASAVTWYDAREQHPTRSEYRLYYPANAAIERAAEGDLLVIGRRPDSTLLVVIAKRGTRAEQEILSLLRITDAGPGFLFAEG